MTIDLPSLARQQGRRRDITLRPIVPTAANATDLAAIIAPAWRAWAENIGAIIAGYDPAPLGDAAAPGYIGQEAIAVLEPGLRVSGCKIGGARQPDGTPPAVGPNPTGDRLTLDSPDQIRAAIDDTANEFLRRLVVAITPALRRFAVRIEKWHRAKWIAAVATGTGVDLSTVLTSSGVAETVEAFVARNVALVKNVSDQAQGRIADVVFRGYQQRLPVREVAKEIGEAVVMGRRRAIGIAADQNAKLSAALDAERQAEAGINAFRWRHSGKLHPRSWHKDRDGKVYGWKTRKERGGDEVIPADDLPGMPPWCGCRSQAWIPLMDEIE